MSTTLLRTPGRYVTTSRLAEHLWPTPPASTNANLRTHATAARRILDGYTPGLGSTLVTRRGSGGSEGAYRMNVDPSETDAGTFTTLADDWRRALAGGDPAGAEATLVAALGLWSGHPGDDLPDTAPLRAWQAGLSERRATASEDLAEARLLLGQYAGAAAALRQDGDQATLRERPVELMMRALRGSGDRSGALAAYRGYRRRLADELGVEPSNGLQSLHIALLEGPDRSTRGHRSGSPTRGQRYRQLSRSR